MLPLIFELSSKARRSSHHIAKSVDENIEMRINSSYLRQSPVELPEVSELEVVRHYTKLSQQNFSVDTNFYPLGSCTMKYNPKVCQSTATHEDFLALHPISYDEYNEGTLKCLYELQEIIGELTGMDAISLAPMAGAQGEFAGIAIIKAYHTKQQDMQRTEILIPDAAHGTNPATAHMCGYTVKEIPTTATGDIDIEVLENVVSEKTAGLMLTNPSTLGVFDREVSKIADIVHNAGGLLYYDGANLNAIAGIVRPREMGFDIVHVNVHKTFATPHGGGGPGAGPIGVTNKLEPFLPVPLLFKNKTFMFWLTEKERPDSIGRLSAFYGNINILLRAYTYLRLTSISGMQQVSKMATLNANYLMTRLRQAGFQLAFPQRRATHEFIITVKNLTQEYGVKAIDFAKNLLEYGFYAPTIYFPTMIPECMLIEPTETESKETLDKFVDAMIEIRAKTLQNPQSVLKNSMDIPIPTRCSGRLNETLAARQPNLKWQFTENKQ